MNEIESEIVPEQKETQEVCVFGMRQLRFIGAAIGIALGMILSAVMSMLGYPWMSDLHSWILCGCSGYIVMRLVDGYLHPECRTLLLETRKSSTKK